MKNELIKDIEELGLEKACDKHLKKVFMQFDKEFLVDQIIESSHYINKLAMENQRLEQRLDFLMSKEDEEEYIDSEEYTCTGGDCENCGVPDCINQEG